LERDAEDLGALDAAKSFVLRTTILRRDLKFRIAVHHMTLSVVGMNLDSRKMSIALEDTIVIVDDGGSQGQNP